MSQAGRLSEQTKFETLTGNSGGPVPPDGSGNINVLGTGTTTVVGNPGTNTLTITPTAGGYPITPYVVGPSTQAGYTTIQSAVDAANAAGGGLVWVQPGTYTENLTLYSGIIIHGSLGQTTISGIHTPPTSGSLEIKNCILLSSTDILSSAAAGTANLEFDNCFFIITNGYIFNVVNWTGTLLLDNCGEGSTQSGVVNNTAGCRIKFLNSEVGNGTTNTFTVGGSQQVRLDTMNINCPISLSGSGDVVIQNGCKFAAPVTFSGSRNGFIIESSFITGANSAITFNSTGALTISNISIDSLGIPVIAGSGAGLLTLTGIEFVQSAGISTSLNVTEGTTYSGKYVANVLGYDVSPKADVNCDVLTVNVTGTPKLSWVESIDGFRLTKGIVVGDSQGNLSHTVNGASVGSDLEIHSVAAQDLGGLTLHRHTNTALYGGHILSLRSDGTHAAPTIVSNNDVVARYIAAGYDGTDYALMADMRVEVDGTPGANDMPGRFVFLTSPDGTQIPSEALRIDQAQKITFASYTQNSLPYFGASGLISEVGPLTDGQLIIGATGGAPAAANLTSTGGTVTITNSTNSINLETSGGLMWNVETGTSANMAVNNGYIGNNAAGVTFTLPATAAVGDRIRVTGLQASWTIAQNAGQTVYFGNQSSTTGVGGSLASTHARDAVEMVCVVANNDFQILSSVGNITVT